VAARRPAAAPAEGKQAAAAGNREGADTPVAGIPDSPVADSLAAVGSPAVGDNLAAVGSPVVADNRAAAADTPVLAEAAPLEVPAGARPPAQS
jgi:hypothetical protein